MVVVVTALDSIPVNDSFSLFDVVTVEEGCEPSGNITVVNSKGIRSYLKII